MLARSATFCDKCPALPEPAVARHKPTRGSSVLLAGVWSPLRRKPEMKHKEPPDHIAVIAPFGAVLVDHPPNRGRLNVLKEPCGRVEQLVTAPRKLVAKPVAKRDSKPFLRLRKHE